MFTVPCYIHISVENIIFFLIRVNFASIAPSSFWPWLTCWLTTFTFVLQYKGELVLFCEIFILHFTWHSPATPLFQELGKFFRTLREHVGKSAIPNPPASLRFQQIRWKIQIKPPGWSSYTAKGPRRDHKQGIRVLWCEIEEIILSCVPLPLCHCRVHIDNRRNIFVSALVLVDGARTEKWKTSRSATNIPDHMLRCLWRQNWFNWKLYIPTLNIICPVRYSKICIKICKLFFDLFGCIWAQTPPVFGCSCITCDQTELFF